MEMPEFFRLGLLVPDAVVGPIIRIAERAGGAVEQATALVGPKGNQRPQHRASEPATARKALPKPRSAVRGVSHRNATSQIAVLKALRDLGVNTTTNGAGMSAIVDKLGGLLTRGGASQAVYKLRDSGLVRSRTKGGEISWYMTEKGLANAQTA